MTTAAVVAVLGSAAPVQAQRVLGIDVSAWQTDITTTEWATFKRPTDQAVNQVFGDGRDFVFIRSSRGGTTGIDKRSGGFPTNDNDDFSLSQRYDDLYFVQNITRATAAGLLAGPYHFSRPDIIQTTQNSGGIANTGTDEANHFMQMAGAWMRPGYLIPVHDLEAGDGIRSDNEMTQFAIDFSNRIYEVMGIRPAIYVNGNYAEFIIGQASSALKSQLVPVTPLWSARWPNQDDPDSILVQTAHPKDSYSPIYGPWDDAPNPTHPWTFWQYASTAHLNGHSSGNIDVNVAQGGMEFLKDQLVPALWVTNSNGQWTTLTNWNSGQTPTAPVQGPGQMPRVGTMTLPATRLPGGNDTVILDRPGANIVVTLSTGTQTIRKLYVRETLSISGGSLVVGYVPSSDSTPIAAQFSGPVTLSGSGSLNVHTLQVDAGQTFTLTGGTLTFNTMNLMPHATTPAKILMSGNATFSGLSSVSATIANGAGTGSSGLIDLGGATRTFDVVNVASGVDLSVNVPIVNGGLNKTNLGTLALNAANTYTGATTVQRGRIELGGSLNGNLVVGGGVLAFGAATGIRAVNGNLSVNAGGTFRVRINGTTAGTQYDRISLTNPASAVVLAGTLDLIAAPALAAGSTFRIVDSTASATATTGTFAGLPQNAEFYEDGQWWRISYTGGSGNDVVLTRINPTPWQTWQLANFPANVNDPAIVGDFIDGEEDGIVNLLEYAFGGNPTVGAQTPLPQSSILGGRLTITFTRVVANTDLTIVVQGADDLAGPWTDLATSINGAATNPLVAGVTVTETGTGVTRSVEVRDLYFINNPLHPKRFLRVEVRRP